MEEIGKRKTSWHLWLIGVIAILWNAMGAFDYVMTQTRNEAYMAEFSPEQLAYFYGFPAWAEAAWAIAVWGGVLGAVLLLLRSRFAAVAFLVSFIAMIVTTVYSYGLSEGMKMMGAGGAAFSGVIFVIALLLLIYARAMTAKGVLK